MKNYTDNSKSSILNTATSQLNLIKRMSKKYNRFKAKLKISMLNSHRKMSNMLNQKSNREKIFRNSNRASTKRTTSSHITKIKYNPSTKPQDKSSSNCILPRKKSSSSFKLLLIFPFRRKSSHLRLQLLSFKIMKPLKKN